MHLSTNRAAMTTQKSQIMPVKLSALPFLLSIYLTNLLQSSEAPKMTWEPINTNHFKLHPTRIHLRKPLMTEQRKQQSLELNKLHLNFCITTLTKKKQHFRHDAIRC